MRFLDFAKHESTPDFARCESILSRCLCGFKASPSMNYTKKHVCGVSSRDAKKYTDTLCRRCGKEQEDQTHWLLCEENRYKIEDAIFEALEQTEDERKVQREELEEITQRIKENLKRGEEAIPISIITKSDILTKKGRKDKKKTVEFTNRLVKKIYENMWKKSRVLINSLPAIEGDPEEIPEQRKHRKDHKEKKLIWFNKWRDTFINENTTNYNID
ncbi:hypothetical protein C2G38_2157148 [Gigaspora rosea]|uniref:Uncharacterized protein n=1 Tax=Gigaspora rosea TaxID=44941 RepID=A0A397W627_9GLOM|nr:hypothetical protein C2G38_2157148 [Gigaspora rosea]